MSKLYGKPTDAGNMYVDTLMSISAGAFSRAYFIGGAFYLRSFLCIEVWRE